MRNYLLILLMLMIGTLYSCQSDDVFTSEQNPNVEAVATATRAAESTQFYVGADLSYTNELEDTGVKYLVDGSETDIYSLIHQYGANMVRLRLWHNPTWTNYSNLKDVKKSAKRIKNAGMSFLLDFHYSDTWTDPQQNVVPAAWAAVVDNTDVLVYWPIRCTTILIKF